MTKSDKVVKKSHKKWETSKKCHKLVQKSVKMLETSEIKTQKCKFKWHEVTN